MSTRCRIGIENKNGTITSIYCHHDGYLEGVGSKLKEYYKNETKIRELMKLGDMSSLGTEPVDNPRAWEVNLNILSPSWFDDMKEIHPDNMCDTYASRGEDCLAETHANLEEALKVCWDCDGEYFYLFRDNKWYYTNHKNKLNLLEV